MYHSNLGPSLRQRFDNPRKAKLKCDSAERFSSYESPPPSDHQLQEFSDYQSPPKHQKLQKVKKQKSYILVQQLPLQYQSSSKKQKPKGRDPQPTANKVLEYDQPEPVIGQQSKSFQSKLNTSIKYNYMQQVTKQLSTIKQDDKEYLRQSIYASHNIKPVNHFYPDSSVFLPTLSHPDPHPYHYLIDEELKMQNRIQLEQQKLRTEELRLRNALIQQENISLKERVYFLENQLRKKHQERVKESEIIANKHSLSIEQELLAAKQQTKQKLLNQIASLQQRCHEMKEEMTAYKLKQEERLNILLQQQHTTQSNIIHSINEYHSKFADVFLNMVSKLPINLPEGWSKKKKIAVGWRIVKHFVRKALKLGITPPTIVQSEDLH